MRIRFFLLVILQILILAGMIGYRYYWLATGEEVVLRVSPVDPRDLFRGDYVRLAYEISSLDLDQLSVKEDFRPKEKIYVILEKGSDGTWKASGAAKTPPSGKKFIQGLVEFERKDSSRWEITLRDDQGNLHSLSPRWWSEKQPGGRMTFCLDKRGQVVSFVKEDPSRKDPCRGGPFLTGTVADIKATPFRLVRVEYGIESFFVQEGKGRDIESRRAGPDIRVEAVLRKDGKAMLKSLLVDGKAFH
jgi:uncharacterized membrane-anchored protein